MSMDLDKDDLTARCVDAPAEEVDQIHRLLHEWSVGPDSSFPVQLAVADQGAMAHRGQSAALDE